MFFQLAVVLFFSKFVYMREASCKCGESSEEDCIEAKDLFTTVYMKRKDMELMDNYQYCYEYRLLHYDGTDCHTAIPAISNDTYPSLNVEITRLGFIPEARQYITATPNLSEGYILSLIHA